MAAILRRASALPVTTPPGPWWDPDGFWFGLHTLLDPLRVPYFRTALQVLGRPRVLDVGSGGGFVAAGLAQGAQITALDRSLSALAEARRAGLDVVAADAARLPFADAAVDAVICSETLEHVADPAMVIAEAARVTRPGGRFLFSTPVRTSWSRLVLVAAAQRWRPTRVLPRDLHEWRRFLTRDELEAHLAAAGWRLQDVAGIGIRPGALPRALAAWAALKAGRIGYGEAGARIELSLTQHPRLAIIGSAERSGHRCW